LEPENRVNQEVNHSDSPLELGDAPDIVRNAEQISEEEWAGGDADNHLEFGFNELDADSLPESANTDARSEDDLVDEWDGSDESFSLANEPTANP